MKREKSIVESRRKALLDTIRENPDIKVEELAEKFQVSAITIRRDLQYLEDQKKLVRFYGGATVITEKETIEDEVAMYRRLIAEYAASLVQDGDSIFINTSSNALMTIEYMQQKKNISIITNNGKAIYVDRPNGVEVFLTGGELRYPKETMVGEFAERNLQNVYAKKSFIGCSGISVSAGMTTEIANEVNLNKLMLGHTLKDAYILVDHTKIGKNRSFRTCSLNKITNIITDEKAPKEEVNEMRKMGIKVHIVHKNDTFN